VRQLLLSLLQLKTVSGLDIGVMDFLMKAEKAIVFSGAVFLLLAKYLEQGLKLDLYCARSSN